MTGTWRSLALIGVIGLALAACDGGETSGAPEVSAAGEGAAGAEEAAPQESAGPPAFTEVVDVDGCAWPAPGMFLHVDQMEPDPRLCLTAEAESSEVRPGESLVLRLHVENRSDEDVKFETRGEACPARFTMLGPDRELFIALDAVVHGGSACGAGTMTFTYPAGEVTTRELEWPMPCEWSVLVKDVEHAHFGEFVVAPAVPVRGEGQLFAPPLTVTLVDDKSLCG